MTRNSLLFCGEKETFITRVLMNKVQEKGTECVFIPNTINSINSHIGEAFLVAVILADEETLPEDLIHFLSEKLEENDLKLVVIGEKDDVENVCSHMSRELIYKTYVRPVDNEAFATDMQAYAEKAAAGEFKKSILIVDDDPNYLKLVREWLKDVYKVSMVNSGLQALKWLGMNKVDLILLDHEMPVTTGPQVLEMLRSDPETKDIPVIFLTGKGDKESVMKVVALKPEGYFLKTIQKDELIEELQDFFIRHK